MSFSRTPVETATAYHEAWNSKDVEATLAFLADDVVYETPAGRLEGRDAIRGFIEGFNQIFTGADLLGTFANGDTVALVYDTHTLPVPNAMSFTQLKIADGKIREALFIFDRLPYEQARRLRLRADPSAGWHGGFGRAPESAILTPSLFYGNS